MKKLRIKKEVKELGVIAVIFAILYFTGLHTTVAAYAQRIILFTGIMSPDTEVSLNETQDLDFDLDLRSLNGNDLHLSDLKGKVLFINIWATWCAPCIAEMPNIQSLYNKIDNDNIEFVMLSMDQDQSKARKFIERKEFTFPSYVPASPVPEVFKVPSIPTTFVVNKAGKIVSEEVGMAKYDTKRFKQYLEKLADQDI